MLKSSAIQRKTRNKPIRKGESAATMESSETSPYVMYIFVNQDLKMTAGKTASQVGHIVHIIVDELVRDSYESFPPSEKSKVYQVWSQCCTKIVLKACDDQLKELLKRADARPFYDSGRTTQGTNNSLTVVGLLPGKPQEALIKDFKLL
jgi:peptidyl-tRNA hydrolase